MLKSIRTNPWAIAFFIFIAVTLSTATAQYLEQDNGNLEAYLERFADGIPNSAAVKTLGENAVQAFDSGNCQAAIPLLEAWARDAATLANLYRSTLEPFYGTTNSQQQNANFNILQVEDLVQYEAVSNEHTRNRNRAWVMLGECHAQTGDTVQALGYFLQSLDRISLQSEEIEIWMRAANGVIQIIETE